jgi:hypothetical protein
MPFISSLLLPLKLCRIRQPTIPVHGFFGTTAVENVAICCLRKRFY